MPLSASQLAAIVGGGAATGGASWATLVPGAIETIGGLLGIGSGNKMAIGNVRPTYKGSQIWNNLLGRFESESQYGLSQSDLQISQEQQQNALAGTMNTLLLAGADPNTLADAYSTMADSFNQLGIEDSRARWQKVQALAGVTEQLANAKKDEFLYNEDAPYKDRAQASAAKQQAGWQSLLQGADSLFGNFAKIMNKNYQTSNKPVLADNASGFSSTSMELPNGNLFDGTPITELFNQLMNYQSS